jgi:glyoxylase I family protein
MSFVKQIAHACVMTDNLKAAEEFYCGVLGLEKTFDFNRLSGRMGFYLAAGGRTYIEVFTDKDAPFTPRGQINHFCFEVTSLDEAILHIRKKGVAVTNKKYGVDDTWQAWLADPSGSRIELFEYTAKSAQFVGGDRTPDW